MANVTILVANPTSADVTVNAKTAVKGTVTSLSLDDTTNEAYQFLAADCALVSVSAETSLSKRSHTAFLLERLQHRQ